MKMCMYVQKFFDGLDRKVFLCLYKMIDRFHVRVTKEGITEDAFVGGEGALY